MRLVRSPAQHALQTRTLLHHTHGRIVVGKGIFQGLVLLCYIPMRAVSVPYDCFDHLDE